MQTGLVTYALSQGAGSINLLFPLRVDSLRKSLFPPGKQTGCPESCFHKIKNRKNITGVAIYRVSTVREKVREKKIFFKVRELSGNFESCQGIMEFKQKPGNFEITSL